MLLARKTMARMQAVSFCLGHVATITEMEGFINNARTWFRQNSHVSSADGQQAARERGPSGQVGMGQIHPAGAGEPLLHNGARTKEEVNGAVGWRESLLSDGADLFPFGLVDT